MERSPGVQWSRRRHLSQKTQEHPFAAEVLFSLFGAAQSFAGTMLSPDIRGEQRIHLRRPLDMRHVSGPPNNLEPLAQPGGHAQVARNNQIAIAPDDESRSSRPTGRQNPCRSLGTPKRSSSAHPAPHCPEASATRNSPSRGSETRGRKKASPSAAAGRASAPRRRTPRHSRGWPTHPFLAAR